MELNDCSTPLDNTKDKETMEKLTNVLVSIPNQSWIHTSCVYALMEIMNDARYEVDITLPYRMPIENNRNTIAKTFWESDSDFWLSYDDDNPPARNPLDLIELDKDIIGLPTPMWKFKPERLGQRPVWLNAFMKNKKGDAYEEFTECEGLKKVDAIGTGCFLVARRVFEHPDMQKGAFFRTWDENGLCKTGGDLMFCERAIECGFEVYAHYDYTCHHYKEISLRDVTYGFMKMNESERVNYKKDRKTLQEEIVRLTKLVEKKESNIKENLIEVS